MYLSKILVTRWQKIDGVWQDTRELIDVSKREMVGFYRDEVCASDSYIRNVEFIYEWEDK